MTAHLAEVGIIMIKSVLPSQICLFATTVSPSIPFLVLPPLLSKEILSSKHEQQIWNRQGDQENQWGKASM